MVDSEGIFKQANRLVQKHGTRDPIIIAEDSGIIIYPLEGDAELLGMYTVNWKHRIMLLNERLGAYQRRLVAAHELGHDARHRDLARGGVLREFTLFNLKDRTEYEANAFAAHLLLDNDIIIEMAKNGYTVQQIAMELHTMMELVNIKITEINRLGENLRVPFDNNSCFLSKVHPEEDGWS